jgi:hypothetical protein
MSLLKTDAKVRNALHDYVCAQMTAEIALLHHQRETEGHDMAEVARKSGMGSRWADVLASKAPPTLTDFVRMIAAMDGGITIKVDALAPPKEAH